MIKILNESNEVAIVIENNNKITFNPKIEQIEKILKEENSGEKNGNIFL